MLKNISRLECTVNEKSYRFDCDNDSPLEHVKEALFQFQKYIGFVEDSVKAQKEADKEKSEEVVDDSKLEELNKSE